VRTYRSRHRLFPVSAVGLLVVAVTLTACSASHGASDSPPTVGTAAQRTVPAAVDQLPFEDAQGHRVTLSSLRGKTVVLTDFLSLCQEVCPLTSANLGRVQQAVSKAGRQSDIELVEVTVDPPRDTPARLAAYGKLFGVGANWKLLTGTAANVAALWKWFGVAYERQPESSPAAIDWWTGKPLTYDVGHSDVMFFLNSHGVERYLITGSPDASAVPLPAPMATFLDDDGRSNLASPAAGAWTAADIDAVLSWLTGDRITAA
jgi:protein SCO1